MDALGFLRRLLLLNLLLLPLHSCSSVTQLFEAWCNKHGKTYSSEEEKQQRLEIFEDNYAFVKQHNEMSNSSYSLALNAFADLSHHEFKATHLGLAVAATSTTSSAARRNVGEPAGEVVRDNIPAAIDWSQEGAVTDVKDQGKCGASWAFAATGAIEGINKIVTGSLISLSEQELIDCDRPHNQSCEGGFVDYAYQFVIENHGIDTEYEYPYRGQNWVCDEQYIKRRYVTIDGYTDVPANNEKLLLQAVAAQPVSASICASDREFQFYHWGIFTGPCSTTLDHAVLIVGYGSLNELDYWIVKNSWGQWGMSGYILLLRNTGDPQGLCGINMLASYPTKTSPNPPAPPPPGPVMCDLLNYCPKGEFCCCSWSVLGLCLAWKCCAYSTACCKNQHHCRPSDFPVWNTKTNMYLKHTGNATTEAIKKRGSSRKFGGWNSFVDDRFL
ncbi:hypothetical protein ACOSQ3_011249 [Xanthoceras sorbifolium]